MWMNWSCSGLYLLGARRWGRRDSAFLFESLLSSGDNRVITHGEPGRLPGCRGTGWLTASRFFPSCLVVRWLVWELLVGTSASRQDPLALCFHKAMTRFSEMTSLNSPGISSATYPCSASIVWLETETPWSLSQCVRERPICESFACAEAK